MDLFDNPVGCLTSPAFSRLKAAKMRFNMEVVQNWSKYDIIIT